MLCEKFKLENLELMGAFNAKQKEQLTARQRKRLLDRGFKGIAEPEDPEAPPEVDEEIMNDPEEFEKGEQDLKDLKAVIDVKKGLIMDGNWRAPIVDDFGSTRRVRPRRPLRLNTLFPTCSSSPAACPRSS